MTCSEAFQKGPATYRYRISPEKKGNPKTRTVRANGETGKLN